VDIGSSFLEGKASHSKKLTTYLSLKPRLEVSGALYPFTLAEVVGEQCVQNIVTKCLKAGIEESFTRQRREAFPL
jgi:hypothetical protein